MKAGPIEDGRQGGDQGRDGSRGARSFAHCALSSGSRSVQRGQSRLGTCLGDFDQVTTRQVCRLCAPSSTSHFSLLRGSQDLLFRVHPRAILARLREAVLTLIPVRLTHMWHCSSRLASGCASSCSTSPCWNAAPFTAGRPAMALGRIWPVSRRALRDRLMGAPEMAKVSATSAWLKPASMLASTRCLKSREEAFMSAVYHSSILLYTALVMIKSRRKAVRLFFASDSFLRS